MNKDVVINVEDVFWQQKGQVILDKVNWQVKAGEHWAIVGLNGSGKTSILNMISGYLWPTSGQIHILGHQLGRVDVRELRKKIGWVSSSFLDLHRPQSGNRAIDVVISGKHATLGIYHSFTEEDYQKGRALLQQFQAEHIADRPFQILSQGEKQKIMLARAWMSELELLILDEPCGGMDIRMREEFLEIINQNASLPDSPTMIYVTHHIEEVVPAISHSLLLKEGRVIASGKKEKIIEATLLEETLDIDLEVQWNNQRPWIIVNRGS